MKASKEMSTRELVENPSRVPSYLLATFLGFYFLTIGDAMSQTGYPTASRTIPYMIGFILIVGGIKGLMGPVREWIGMATAFVLVIFDLLVFSLTAIITKSTLATIAVTAVALASTFLVAKYLDNKMGNIGEE